jgi:hypothetical protein
MNTNQVYNLSNIKQLIDLNGDIVNFTLSFEVVSKSNKPFDALVVTQEMLDSGEELQYQRAEGSINGQITNDKDLYNNYFLILKSDEPNECDVSIQLVEIQPNPSKKAVSKKGKTASKIPWKSYLFYFFIGIVIAILLYIIYISFFQKNNEIVAIKDDINKLSDGIEQKITGLNEGLNSKLNGLSTDLHDITKSLDGLEGGLSTKITQSLDGLEGGLSSKFSQSLNGLEGGLTSKISKSLDGLEGGLSNKISQSIDGLNQGLSTKLTEKLDGINNGFNKFDESLHGINQKFDGLNSGLTNKFDTSFQEINHKLSELDGGIANKLTNGLTEMKGELVETIGSIPEIKSVPSISNEDIYNKIQNLKLKS